MSTYSLRRFIKEESAGMSWLCAGSRAAGHADAFNLPKLAAIFCASGVSKPLVED